VREKKDLPMSEFIDLPPPYSDPLRVTELATRKPNRFKLSLDQAERAKIAAWAEVDEVRMLNFEGDITAKGRSEWVLTGKLTARVKQACVITAEPVITEIREDVTRRYRDDIPDPTGEETEMPDDDTLDPLGAVIDVGHVALEALELAIPLYPRAKGAELGAVSADPEGAEPINDDVIKPFAGLADLLKARDSKE
jgi:uncharacterized metal-binding protein YceD (DUF177 family)